MCYNHISENDFIKEVKDWYKFDFTERELRDIFRYYQDDEDTYFPTEINLRKHWKFYKTYKQAVEDLWDENSIYSVDDLDTDKKRMEWIEQNYSDFVIYNNGILIKIVFKNIEK